MTSQITPDQMQKFVAILDEFERYRDLTHAEKERLIAHILSRPYLDLRVDWAFKHVLKDKNLLKMLLNDFLPEDITEVEHLPNEIDRVRADDKNIIMDVLCTAKDGRQFICEMQRERKNSFKNRMFYYGASMIQSQLKGGESYDKLKEVYVICFMDFTLEHESDQLVYRYVMREQDTGELYGRLLSIYFCELPRLQATSIDGLEPIESWFYIFRNLCNFAGKPQDIGSRYAPIAEAAKANLLANEEPYQYMRAMITEEERLDISTAGYEYGYNSAKKEWYAKGLTEGEAKGVAKGEAIGIAKGEAIGVAKGEAIGIAKGEAKARAKIMLEMVTRLTDMGYDADFICAITGLSKEELTELN